jgi:gluconokinase
VPQHDLDRIRPRAIIIMGVSASGKSTLGVRLSEELGCPFLEGDLFHLPESVEKMRAGLPLTDEDRWPWLDRLVIGINEALARNGVVVATCSALKSSYRSRLRLGIAAPASFVLLDAGRDELARRLDERQGHYMPASLLASQLDALEPPRPGEPILVLDSTRAPDRLSAEALDWLETAQSAEG